MKQATISYRRRT